MVILKQKKNQTILFCMLFVFSIVAVLAYFVLEYLGIKGCILCFYQRIPYIINVFLGIIYLLFHFISNKDKALSLQNIIIMIMLILFLIDGSIAFYHILVLYGFVIAQCAHTTITDSILSSESLTELYEFIINNDEVDCTSSSFDVFGYPLSLWNFASISAIMLMSIFLFRYDKRKNNKTNVKG